MDKNNSITLPIPQIENFPANFSDLKRTTVHLADQERDDLRLIRDSLELSSSALAIRLSIRNLAADIETQALIKEVLDDWNKKEEILWQELV